MQCHSQASCQVLLLLSTTAFTSCSPRSLLFLFSPHRSAGKHKRRLRGQSLGCTSPWMTPRLGWGGDGDKRAEVKAEEEDLRRGVGVVVISWTRLCALCHWVTASWDEEWHPLPSLFWVSFHLFNESIVWAGGRMWSPIWLSLTCKESVAVTADEISGL